VGSSLSVASGVQGDHPVLVGQTGDNMPVHRSGDLTFEVLKVGGAGIAVDLRFPAALGDDRVEE